MLLSKILKDEYRHLCLRIDPPRRDTKRQNSGENFRRGQIRREAYSVYSSGGECCGAADSKREICAYVISWCDVRTSVTTTTGAWSVTCATGKTVGACAETIPLQQSWV